MDMAASWPAGWMDDHEVMESFICSANSIPVTGLGCDFGFPMAHRMLTLQHAHLGACGTGFGFRQ